MKPHSRTLLDDGSVIELTDRIETRHDADVVTGGDVRWLLGAPTDGPQHGVGVIGSHVFRVHLPDVQSEVARPGRCCDVAVEEDYYIAQVVYEEMK